MNIRAVQGISTQDFPHMLAAVFYTQGCNFRCPYCHNPELINYGVPRGEYLMSTDEALGEIKRDWVDGVVITGGEPTVHEDLPQAIYEISKKYRGKLDTNGSNSEMLKDVLQYLDYVALDVKTDPLTYNLLFADQYVKEVVKSVQILKDSQVDYEFRLTAVEPFLRPDNIESLGEWMKGGMKLYLQQFNDTKVLSPMFPFKKIDKETLKYYRGQLDEYLPTYLRL